MSDLSGKRLPLCLTRGSHINPKQVDANFSELRASQAAFQAKETQVERLSAASSRLQQSVKKRVRPFGSGRKPVSSEVAGKSASAKMLARLNRKHVGDMKPREKRELNDQQRKHVLAVIDSKAQEEGTELSGAAPEFWGTVVQANWGSCDSAQSTLQ